MNDGVQMTPDERTKHRMAWRSFYKALPTSVRVRQGNLHRALVQAWHLFCRHLVTRKYGGACACCGESLTYALTYDHVQGEGGRDRKVAADKGINFSLMLLDEGCPPRIQLLCLTCNQLKDDQPECPHQALRRIERQLEEERAA